MESKRLRINSNIFLNLRAREALRQCLPDQLKDETFATCLKDDKSTKHWLSSLLKNVNATPPSSAQSNGPDLRSTPVN
jgi:CCR4-NOT transcription complex subunit 9